VKREAEERKEEEKAKNAPKRPLNFFWGPKPPPVKRDL